MAKTKILHTKAEVVSKGIKADEGILDAVVGSSNILDRAGDIIDQAGWKLQNYKKTNPVILWGHNVKDERPPIGKALKVWIQDKGEKTAKLMFKVQFDLQDNFAKEIFRKVKDGFINTVSVGFLPMEWEHINEDDPFSGRRYIKQELLELSFVPVPANPEAVVALKEMNDKRFDPVEIDELYPQVKKKPEGEEKEVSDDEVGKPYPNEHACRIKSPDAFQDGSFRSMSRKHKGKPYRVIMGKLKGEDTMTEQAYRYKKSTWSSSEARTHCKSHKGTFEPASGGKEEDEKKEVYECECVDCGHKLKTKEHCKDVKCPECGGKMRREERPGSGKEPESESGERAKPIQKKKPAKKKKSSTGTDKEDSKEKKPNNEPKESKLPTETKGVIPYKDLGKAPESAPWDGSGEVRKAEIGDLKLICTWYDSGKPDVKSSYKLPHHKAEGHSCVWRGVAAAMAALLGARGGAKIPSGDRKGVYNHLKKHYAQFDKKAPDFKAVEEQVLKSYDEEIHALILDREDRYMIRLIKKIIKRQAIKKEVKSPYTQSQIEASLDVVNKALSQLTGGSQEGGGK